MSRTTLAIQMLNILSTNSIISRKELARRLEVKTRYISLLKDELIIAGYNIETIYGKNGGYRLNTNNIIPIIAKDTYKDLSYLLDYIKQKDILVYKEIFQKSVECILSSNLRDHDKIDLPYKYFPKDRFKIKSVDRFNKNLSALMDSAIDRKQIILHYYDQNLSLKKELFQVEYVFEQSGKWFVKGLLKKEVHWYTQEVQLQSIYDVEKTLNQFICLQADKKKIIKDKHYVDICFSRNIDVSSLDKLGFIYENNPTNNNMIRFWLDDIFSFHLLSKKISQKFHIVEHNLF